MTKFIPDAQNICTQQNGPLINSFALNFMTFYLKSTYSSVRGIINHPPPPPIGVQGGGGYTLVQNELNTEIMATANFMFFGVFKVNDNHFWERDFHSIFMCLVQTW